MQNIINTNKLPRIKFKAGLLSQLKMLFIYKKNIVVLHGNKGVFLSAFINYKLVENSFIAFQENSLDLNAYKSFLDKFRNFNVIFLLDGPECKMRHDLIPLLQSIVKTDSIEQFISGYFNKDDIIAYYIYEVITNPSEVCSTIIVSTPCVPPLSEMLECTLQNASLNFKGLYFLALELNTLINKIIYNTNNNKYANYFQICVFFLEASGIKFVIKHKNNIIKTSNFDYPTDKSNSYIQGIIEQEINDCLILFKNYISNLNNEVCILFIVDDNFQTLLKHTNLGDHTAIFIPVDDILKEQNLLPNKFIDSHVSQLFLKYKNFLAYNNYLKSIERLNVIGSISLKLFSIVILILLFIAGTIKYHTYVNNNETLFLGKKYYSVSQEYHDVKSKYPYINNTINLADFYVIEKLLEEPVVLPFDLLQKLIIAIGPEFQLQQIKWELTNIDTVLLISKRHLKIKILLKYTTNNVSVNQAIEKLNEHMKNIQQKLGDVAVHFSIFEDKIIDVMGRIVIPLSMHIIDNKG
jgi:hypothetical protein